MRIIPNRNERCFFSHADRLLVLPEFVNELCAAAGCETVGLYLTIASLCGTKGYVDFDTLKNHCKESPAELLEWLNALETNGFIKIEGV